MLLKSFQINFLNDKSIIRYSVVNLKIEILLTVSRGSVKWLLGIIGTEVRMPYTYPRSRVHQRRGWRKGGEAENASVKYACRVKR